MQKKTFNDFQNPFERKVNEDINTKTMDAGPNPSIYYQPPKDKTDRFYVTVFNVPKKYVKTKINRIELY